MGATTFLLALFAVCCTCLINAEESCQNGEIHSNGEVLFCDFNCSPHCIQLDNVRHCNKTTRLCLDGCDEGYYGLTCSKRCSSGCRGDVCTEIDGVCLRGCKDGYQGDLCVPNTMTKPSSTASRVRFNMLKKVVTERVSTLTVKGCSGGSCGATCSEPCTSTLEPTNQKVTERQVAAHPYPGRVVVIGAILSVLLLLVALLLVYHIRQRQRRHDKSKLEDPNLLPSTCSPGHGEDCCDNYTPLHNYSEINEKYVATSPGNDEYMESSASVSKSGYGQQSTSGIYDEVDLCPVKQDEPKIVVKYLTLCADDDDDAA